MSKVHYAPINELGEWRLVRGVEEWVTACVYRSIPCSRMPRSRMVGATTTTSPSSRPAAAADYVHNEVADSDDYSCDSVHNGSEYLYEGRT